MKPIQRVVNAVVLASLFLLPQAIPRAEAEGVPEAWLDSLNANLWRTESQNALASFRIHSSTRILDGDGKVKHEEDTWQFVEIQPNGDKVFHNTDSTGVILPGDKETVVKAGEDTTDVQQENGKTEVNVSVGPLDPVKPENRGNHRFNLLPSPGENLGAFSCEPIDRKRGGFEGTITVDTTSWLPVSTVGSPVPTPNKKIKDLEMRIEYQKVENKYAFPKHVTAKVTAKWLLFTFHMETEQTFFDMVQKEGGE